jgi:hypothetical protein
MGKSRIAPAAAPSDPFGWLATRVDFERTPPPATPAAFGLARMRRLLAAAGNPHRPLAVVHVAGTKGKGSTVAMLAAILEEAGLRTGRYMSPHVHGVEERICIDGRPIAPADLAAACGVVRPAVEVAEQAAHFKRVLETLDFGDALIVTDDPSVLQRPAIRLASVLATPPTQAVDESIAAMDPDEPTLYMLTSGSTSLPKAVVQTQRMLTSNLAQGRQVLGDEVEHGLC